MKVSKTEYDNTMDNDTNAIGIYVQVEHNGTKSEQYFTVEDCCEELGRVAGNLISQMATIKDVSDVTVLSEGTINKMRSTWRGVLRG